MSADNYEIHLTTSTLREKTQTDRPQRFRL